MLAGQLGLNSKEQRLAKNSLIRIWFDYITRAADVDQITQAEYFIGRQWFWQDHFPGLAGIGQASKLVGWNQARNCNIKNLFQTPSPIYLRCVIEFLINTG